MLQWADGTYTILKFVSASVCKCIGRWIIIHDAFNNNLYINLSHISNGIMQNKLQSSLILK